MNHGIIRVLAGITILAGAATSRGEATKLEPEGCNGQSTSFPYGEHCPDMPGFHCMVLMPHCQELPDFIVCDDAEVTCYWGAQ